MIGAHWLTPDKHLQLMWCVSQHQEIPDDTGCLLTCPGSGPKTEPKHALQSKWIMRKCFGNILFTLSHRIHGTGIFTYMNGDVYGKCREDIPYTSILWVSNHLLQTSKTMPHFLRRFCWQVPMSRPQKIPGKWGSWKGWWLIYIEKQVIFWNVELLLRIQ